MQYSLLWWTEFFFFFFAFVFYKGNDHKTQEGQNQSTVSVILSLSLKQNLDSDLTFQSYTVLQNISLHYI